MTVAGPVSATASQSAGLGFPLLADPNIDADRAAFETESPPQPSFQESPVARFQEAAGEQHEGRRPGGGLGGEQDARLLATAHRRRSRGHDLLYPGVQPAGGDP